MKYVYLFISLLFLNSVATKEDGKDEILVLKVNKNNETGNAIEGAKELCHCFKASSETTDFCESVMSKLKSSQKLYVRLLLICDNFIELIVDSNIKNLTIPVLTHDSHTNTTDGKNDTSSPLDSGRNLTDNTTRTNINNTGEVSKKEEDKVNSTDVSKDIPSFVKINNSSSKSVANNDSKTISGESSSFYNETEKTNTSTTESTITSTIVGRNDTSEKNTTNTDAVINDTKNNTNTKNSTEFMMKPDASSDHHNDSISNSTTTAKNTKEPESPPIEHLEDLASNDTDTKKTEVEVIDKEGKEKNKSHSEKVHKHGHSSDNTNEKSERLRESDKYEITTIATKEKRYRLPTVLWCAFLAFFAGVLVMLAIKMIYSRYRKRSYVVPPEQNMQM